jgi:phage shock protein PspC (stress-responsive transcriptional regulator)
MDKMTQEDMYMILFYLFGMGVGIALIAYVPMWLARKREKANFK